MSERLPVEQCLTLLASRERGQPIDSIEVALTRFLFMLFTGRDITLSG